MKKQITILSLFVALLAANLNTAAAQEFVKGTKMASLAVGVGNRYGLGFISPSIQGVFDMGITEKLGIGYIGVGGIFAYSGGSNEKNYGLGYSYKYSYTNISFGVRATYHFDLGVDKLDLYGGVLLGYNVSSSKSTYTGTNTFLNNVNYASPSYGGPIGGAFAGARYMFTDNFGGYVELGNAISIMSVGLTLKF